MAPPFMYKTTPSTIFVIVHGFARMLPGIPRGTQCCPAPVVRAFPVSKLVGSRKSDNARKAL